MSGRRGEEARKRRGGEGSFLLLTFLLLLLLLLPRLKSLHPLLPRPLLLLLPESEKAEKSRIVQCKKANKVQNV